MRTFARLILPAALLLLTQACATVTRGTTVTWTVESDPLGANVALSSGERCTTPCTLKKKRKHPFEVTVEKAGYGSVSTQVLSSTSGAGATAMAGNVLVGGVIGLAVDAGTGAMRDLKPNPLVLKLVPMRKDEEIELPDAATTEPAPSPVPES